MRKAITLSDIHTCQQCHQFIKKSNWQDPELWRAHGMELLGSPLTV